MNETIYDLIDAIKEDKRYLQFKEQSLKLLNQETKELLDNYQNLLQELDDLKKFEKYNLDYPSGCIIAKVDLTDCIKIDDEARKMLEERNPLVYSSIIKHTEWNGYGFKLENVKKIEPISVNGKLSLWDYEYK